MIEKNIIKYLPIILNLYIVFIGLSVLFDFYNVKYTTLFVGVIGSGGMVSTFLLYRLSIRYRFCRNHQLLILNVFSFLTIRYFQENGLEITHSLYVVTIPAIILLILHAINTNIYGRKRKLSSNN